MGIPNVMKVFIGLIVIIFMIAIFWLTSWQNYDKEIKVKQKEIIELEYKINETLKQKEEIPKLQSQINGLQKGLMQLKTDTITGLNDTKKLAKIQKQIIEQEKK